MMDAASNPLIENITIMSAARVGKTETLDNIIGFHIHHDPCPMLVILPTFLLAKDWSKIYLAPMLRDTPVLQGLVQEARTKDSNNEILHKTFRDGLIVIGGANSPTSLSMRSVRIVLFDEIDQYPVSAGSEGDPVDLGKKRTETFFNRQHIDTSTPTITGLSRIERSFQDSNQQFYYVPCPHCRHKQILLFSPRSKFSRLAKGYLKFDADNLSWVHYECENCKKAIEEREKTQMLARGQWRPLKPEVLDHAGFQLSALYSPWKSWRDIAKEWLIARREQDIERLKVWINKTCGETWDEDKSIKLDEHAFTDRIEQYKGVPDGVVLLTAGVDIQDDRLEVVVKGWGLKDESWFIDKRIFWGSPDRADVWKQLDDYYDTPFSFANGLQRRIQSMCVDSGSFTEKVYAYVKRKKGKRVFATKGRAGFDREIVGSKVKRNNHGALFFVIGVDQAKETIYHRLTIKRPAPPAEPPFAQLMHFNEQCDEEYFRQLVSERIVVKKKKGFPFRAWELMSGRRNEMLDCEVLNLAAYAVVRPPMERLARQLKTRVESLDSPAPESPKPEAPVRPQRRSVRTRRRYLNL